MEIIKTTNSSEEFKKVAEQNYFSDEELYSAFEEICGSKSVSLFVAKEENDVRGFAAVSAATRDCITLMLLSVDKESRGQGIATSLLKEIIAELNPKAVVCECTDDSLGFFENFGFYGVTLGEKFPGKEAFYCTYRRK